MSADKYMISFFPVLHSQTLAHDPSTFFLYQ